VNGGLARRLGVIALCVVSFVGCLGLAWWQFQRYESATGDWQNFGYMLLWPLFGVFPTFMVWRLRRLRAQDRQPVEKQPPLAPEPPKPARIVAGQDDSDDPELAAYNRYLAKLNALDQQETR
jgi:DNA-binding transcriptional regulator of glucitol operon